LDQYAYIYNLANQRANLTRADHTYYSLAYDKIGQLTIATNPLVPAESRGYLYDDTWNLNDRTNNGAVTGFTVDLKNQLETEAGLACANDANGNLTQAGDPTVTGGYVYTYDDENRLTEIYTNYNITQAPLIGGTTAWRTDFVYDGLGRLRKRTEYLNEVLNSTTEYIYDGNRVIQERDANNNPTAGYTRGNDLSGTLEGAGGIGGLLARSDQFNSGNFTEHDYYFADANGNITYMTDASQATAAQYRYDPFGNTISSSGSMSVLNTYRFSSKEIHANSGMYYYGFRFYDPNLQRWINRDPIQERGGPNLYTYALNRPISLTDPWGLAGNPVMGFGNSYNSDPYGPGGSFYDPGSQYAPQIFPPAFSGSFSFGLMADVSAEAGYGYGAGGTYSFGFGLFYNPQTGFSVGSFRGGGLFAGGPKVGRLPGSWNKPCSPTGRPSGAIGRYAGWGVGPWISNAGSPKDLGGPFDQWNFNSPISGSYAYSDGTWIGSLTYGYGGVASFSTYPTTTSSAGGFSLTTGQPIAYNP
jgi:RHS repeat-associated protein